MATIQAPPNDIYALRKAAASAKATLDNIVSGADTYLAIASPSNAQIAAQVRALTQAAKASATIDKQVISALARLVRNQTT